MKHPDTWFWISFSCGLYWLSYGLIRPVIALYALSLHLDKGSVSLILSVFSFLPMLLAIPGGGIADALGRHIVIRAGAIAMFFSGILYFISDSYWLLILAQVLAGIGQMGVWLIVQVLITQEEKKEQRHARLATFTLYMSLGQVIAPFMGGWLADHLGYAADFFAYLILSSILIYSCWKTKDTTVQPKKAIRYQTMYRDSWRLLKNKVFMASILCTFIVMFITDFRITSLPIYLQSLQMTQTQFGFLVSLGSISALCVKMVFPLLMKRLGPLPLLMLTFSVALCLLFLTPFLTSFLSLAFLIFITGLALGINQPLTLSFIAEQTLPDQRGVGVGLRLMANRAAQLFDPLIFGFIGTVCGYKAAFWVIGGILTFASCLVVILMKRKESEQHDATLFKTV